MTDLAARLARYSYKPGWTIRLGKFSKIDGRRAVVILASVPDVLGRPEPFILCGAKVLPPEADTWSDEKLRAEADIFTDAERGLVAAWDSYEKTQESTNGS